MADSTQITLPPLDIRQLICLESYHAQDGQLCQIVVLRPEHASEVYDLHQIALRALPEGKRDRLLERSYDYFKAHLNSTEGDAVFGAVKGGRLVGQAVIHHPGEDDHDEPYAASLPPALSLQRISILQAVSALTPGLGLMHRVIRHWIDHAYAWDRPHLMARAKCDNDASINAFLKAGLRVASVDHDPVTASPVYDIQGSTLGIKRLKDGFTAATSQRRAADAPRQPPDAILTVPFVLSL
jgi:hypothetical protein